MRRPITILLALTLIVFTVVAFLRIQAFVHLFFTHAGIAVTQQEIKDAFYNDTAAGHVHRPQLIPKIMHQVYHSWGEEGDEDDDSKKMPSDWEEVSKSCKDFHKDWEYNLWTKKSSRDFIETNYPWFLSTYDGYKFPVQRVDTVRYFLLLHYGGIYMDLDNGCLEPLTPLLTYPTFTTDGGRGALSNNILGAEPNHPFWKLLTDSLIPYDYNYFFPYITISYASGQWFETAAWEAYHWGLKREGERKGGELVRIMMDDRPGTEPWVFFSQERGGSWVNWDNKLFLWVGDHLVLLTVGGLGLIAGVVRGLVKVCSRRRVVGEKVRERDGTTTSYKREDEGV